MRSNRNSQLTLANEAEKSGASTPRTLDVEAVIESPKKLEVDEAARHERKDKDVEANVYIQAAKGKASKDMTEAERQMYLSDVVIQGEAKYHKLGWVQLVVVLIVEAIALGSLSLPAAFATLGMIAGVLITVGIGMIAIYTSYIIGQVKLKYPQVIHYADVGPLLLPGLAGKVLSVIIGIAFCLYLILLVGSHCLTGTIAFQSITGAHICSLVWGIVSMVILFICAIPPSFAEQAILGYIDFVSICSAILITLIATGIRATNSDGGMAAVDWSAYPKPGTNFAEAMLAVANIVFAYSFAICQFSFMQEMHTPTDYPKSVWALGMIEIVIYTCTGALGYAFVGQSVKSPALLSAGTTVSRIAFGVAIPVIFISGSINTVTCGRYLLETFLPKSPIRYVNTKKGWTVWIGYITIASIIAWIIAEAIPFFSALLGLVSALFVSGFSLYLPGIMWFALIREGGCFSSKKNIVLTILNTCCIIIGLICFGCGTYGSVQDIAWQFERGTLGGSFSCKDR